MNIAVLVSGGGTNLQALVDAEKNGLIKNGRICAVISSKDGAYALRRAENAGIPAHVLPRRLCPEREAYSDAVLKKLKDVSADLVVYAGFLCILEGRIMSEYAGRMINVHPSLIPSFCGEGYYGLKVHESALARGVKVTGATVHFVTSETDGGPIILQRAVDILPGDTPESLQKRVMESCEWDILTRAVSLFCEGRLRISGRTVIIEEESL